MIFKELTTVLNSTSEQLDEGRVSWLDRLQAHATFAIATE